MFKTATLKKALILLSMGGATFVFGIGLGDWGWGDGVPGCVTNSDLVGFYQTVGDAGIAEFTDTTRDVMPYPEGGDFDNIVVQPVSAFWTAMWDNWVAHQFPLDVGVAGDWVQ